MGYTSYRQKFIAAQMGKATVALESEGRQSFTEIRESLSVDYPPSGAPGGPPARRTGNLQNGIDYRVAPKRVAVNLVVFSNRAENDPRVPEWLEFGTSRMRERPYMGPAYQNTKERISKNLPEALKV